jgi:hypothetical protein
MVSGPVFIFCAPEPIFDGTEGIGSSFHVLKVSGLVFILCALGPIFGGGEGVRSRFHVLRSRTRFWRY